MTSASYLTTTQAAAALGVSHSYVKLMARLGRIPGAYKLGQRCWCIPASWSPQLGPGGRGRHVTKAQADKETE